MVTLTYINPWDNPNNYKKTYRKMYTISVSMPILGTEVYNYLEKSKYITNKNRPFVLTGTRGEQWIIDSDRLCRTYTLENGEPLTVKFLMSKIITEYKDGKSYPCIRSFKIRAIPGAISWVINIPKNCIFTIKTSWGDELLVNDPDRPNAVGDFIVCSDINGKPNLNDRRVVDGEVFLDTYSNIGNFEGNV